MRPLAAYKKAQEKREELQTQARAIGISEDYIDLLVDRFYDAIQVHPELGPVFATKISDWGPHLAKMKLFWSSIMLRTAIYEGKPIPAHQAVSADARPEYFASWLTLFEQVLRETAPNEQVVAAFMARAREMGARIRKAMYPDYDAGT